MHSLMFHYLRFLVIAAIGLWLLASCGSDVPFLGPEPERPAIPQFPILSFEDSTDIISMDAFAFPGEVFNVRLTGIKGDSLLKDLTIRANTFGLEASRITVNGATVSSSVIPILLDDRNGFTWDIGILAQQDSSKVIYEFMLQDETGRTDFLDLLIDTKITANTPPIIEMLGQSADEVLAGESVSFDFSLDAIGAPIKAITVYQGAEIIAANRVIFGGEQASTNPFILNDMDREGFSKSFEITTDSTFGGRQGFTFEFLDSLDNKFFQEVSLNTIRRVETKEVTLNRNQSLELLTGMEFPIGFTKIIDENERSNIKDVSRNADDWDRKIMATNQSELRNISSSQGLVFDDIVGENTISEAWVASPLFTDQIIYADTTFSTTPEGMRDTLIRDIAYPISDRLEVNDLFIAEDFNRYFLIRVKVIDNVNNTYTFDIKF